MSIRKKILVYVVSLVLLVSFALLGLSTLEISQIHKKTSEGNRENIRYITAQTEETLENLHTDLQVEYSQLYVQRLDDSLDRLETALFNAAKYITTLYEKGNAAPADDNTDYLLMPNTRFETVQDEYNLLTPVDNFFRSSSVFRAEDEDGLEGIEYYYLTESGLLIDSGDYVDRSLVSGHNYPIDLRYRPWYQNTIYQGDVWWDDIYTIADGDAKIITCSAPVYLDGEAKGVVAMDLSMDMLKDRIIEVESDYVQDIAIVNSDMSLGFSLNKDPRTEEYIKQNREAVRTFISTCGEDFFGMDTVEGLTYVLLPFKSTDWVIMMTYELSDVLGATDTIVTSVVENNEETQRHLDVMAQRYQLFFVIVILGVIVLAVFFARRSARQLAMPIEMLLEKTRQIGQGELDAKFEDINTGDEIEDIANAFNDMTVSLKAYINNLAEVTAEKKRVETELDVARQIQKSMLPNIFPPYPNNDEFDLYALMEPAREVGGDFYDFYMLDDDHLVLTIADVSGKGIGAALFMVIAKTITKNYASENLAPGEIFYRANNTLCEGNDAGMFVTTFLCVIKVSTGEVAYVNAGHNPPVIIRSNGKAEYIVPPRSLALAVMEDRPFKESSLVLEPGDQIFLYTDGVTEAFNPRGEMFGEDRLLPMLEKIWKEGGSVESFLNKTKEQIDIFAETEPQADDITMLTLTYKGQNHENQ